MSQGKLEAVQTLRGLAAILVVVGHLGAVIAPLFKGGSFLYSQKLVYMGGMGVDIFFCISGFIMMHTYRGASGISASWEFLKRRVLRIFPVYIVWSLVALYFIKPHLVGDFKFVALSLSMLSVPPVSGYANLILGQGWTLQYEMYFYLVFALSILITRRVAILVPAVISVLFIASVYGAYDGLYRWLFANQVVFEFLLGMLVSVVVKSYGNRLMFLSKWAFAIPVLLLSISSACIMKIGYSSVIPRVIGMGLPSFFIVIVCVMISMRQVEKRRASVFLGEASYTIYLMHTLLIPPAIILTKLYLSNMNGDLFIIILSSFIVMAGCLSYALVEKPLNWLLLERGKRIPKPSTIKAHA